MKLTSVVVLLLAAPALAADPAFEYGKKEEVQGVDWAAAAQLGFILTTGNSETTTLSAGLMAARKDGANKLQLDVGGAFARSRIFVAIDDDLNGFVEADDIHEATNTTAAQLQARLRYDRFFTERDAAYATARVAFDRPAGKELVTGGQVGYSRILVKTMRTDAEEKPQVAHLVTLEVGYDFTYENYVAPGDALVIHSGRLFVGYNGVLSDVTSVTGSVEALLNLNEEDVPQGTASPIEDTRIVGGAALATKIWKDISFRAAVSVRFDNVPAPLPPLPIPFAAGFVPLAEKLDTTTEVGLIVNFL